MLNEATIITLVTIGGGLIAQAAYLKGVFGTRIDVNAKDIAENHDTLDEINQRLVDGRGTFSEIRESIAAMTGTLTATTGELNRLRDSVVYKDKCSEVSSNIKERVMRLEQKENGNE